MLTAKQIIGRWQLVAAELTVAGQVSNTFDAKRTMIKHFTACGRFYFHAKTADRVPFSPAITDEERLAACKTLDFGAGRYRLKGDEYIEDIEVCSYPNYEGKSIGFSLSVQGEGEQATLIQQGVYPLKMLGFGNQDGYVKETYRRLKELE